jgi:hypothetical protein
MTSKRNWLKWSDAELQILHEVWCDRGTKTADEVAKEYNVRATASGYSQRSPEACACARKKHRRRYESAKGWTKEEQEALEDMVERKRAGVNLEGFLSWSDIATAMNAQAASHGWPQRTGDAYRKRVERNIAPGKKPRSPVEWTQDALEELKKGVDLHRWPVGG